jgi:hypothetical protein
MELQLRLSEVGAPYSALVIRILCRTQTGMTLNLSITHSPIIRKQSSRRLLDHYCDYATCTNFPASFKLVNNLVS